MSTEIKYSKDHKVKFDFSTHTYWNGEKKLQGVTRFISQYKNKFDVEKIATAYAKKHGLNKDELLIKWQVEGELSRVNGTAIHSFFEHYFLTGELLYIDNLKLQSATSFVNDYFVTKTLIPVEAEMIVYNNDLASQVDCIVKNKSGEYFILDWKTCKSISDNGYNKFMLAPFENYPDANFYHYSLQMTLYKKMCKEYKIKDAYIIHLGNDIYNIIKPENILVLKSDTYFLTD